MFCSRQSFLIEVISSSERPGSRYSIFLPRKERKETMYPWFRYFCRVARAYSVSSAPCCRSHICMRCPCPSSTILVMSGRSFSSPSPRSQSQAYERHDGGRDVYIPHPPPLHWCGQRLPTGLLISKIFRTVQHAEHGPHSRVIQSSLWLVKFLTRTGYNLSHHYSKCICASAVRARSARTG